MLWPCIHLVLALCSHKNGGVWHTPYVYLALKDWTSDGQAEQRRFSTAIRYAIMETRLKGIVTINPDVIGAL